MYGSLIISVLEGVIIAFLASIMTVRLSLHKYTSRKWWEAKERTYAKIIRTLSKILIRLRQQEGHYLGIDQLGDDERNEIYKEKKDYRREIENVAREGSFRISNGASNELRNLLKELDKGVSHPIEGIDKEFRAVENCQEKILAEAKRDLGLEHEWYQIWQPK